MQLKHLEKFIKKLVFYQDKTKNRFNEIISKTIIVKYITLRNEIIINRRNSILIIINYFYNILVNINIIFWKLIKNFTIYNNAFIFGKIGGLKMAKFSKNDFLLFKGKKPTFKRVKYGADI